jgi:hypothetical protein
VLHYVYPKYACSCFKDGVTIEVAAVLAGLRMARDLGTGAPRAEKTWRYEFTGRG